MLDILKKAAEEGGRVLLRYFREEHLELSHKTNHENIVTIADKEAQKKIVEVIRKECEQSGIDPNTIGFIGEESLHEHGDHLFIIDPLDGTSNFATGVEDFCVLIAYCHREEVEAGVMYFPTKDVWFSAEKGKGAYSVKQKKIEKLWAQSIDLKNTFLLSSLSYEDEIKAGIQNRILALKPDFRGLRMYGCAGVEIAMVAENISGLTMLFGTSIWDIAPGILILREAGFEMYTWEGNVMKLDPSLSKKTYPFFACHPKHAAHIIDIIQSTNKSQEL